MVATRRQVHAAPDDSAISEQDPDLILRKKPVRKATAKAASDVKTSETGTIGRSTRGKKVDFAEDLELSEAEQAPLKKKKAGRPKRAAAEQVTAEIVEDATAGPKATRATKPGSLRNQRANAIVDEAEEERQPETTKATRSTKAGSVRSRKATVVAEDEPVIEVAKQTAATKAGSLRGRKPAAKVEAPSLPAPAEPRVARQTRGAAPKAQPLSPKKITQISKPQTRNTRNANQKPAAKAAQAKAPANAKSTRRRAVSDENADVVDFASFGDDANQDADVVMLASTPKNTAPKPAPKAQPQDAAINDSNMTMSSRPTTPTDSVGQSLNTVDGVDEENVEPDQEESDDDVEDEAKEEADGSEDELCGPKTPMKRVSPGAYERYQLSVQRTAKKYEEDVRMEKSARRFPVLGSQKGTPQTLKPYRQPVAPSSDARPMRVARAADRAFVFKDLREGRPSPRKNPDVAHEQHEMSFLPDEDIISIDTTPTPEVPIYLESGTESSLDVEDRESLANASMQVDDENDFVTPADVQKYSDDPDETIIVHHIEEEAESSVNESIASFHTEATVLIGEAQNVAMNEFPKDGETESESGSVIMQPSATPIKHPSDTTPARTSRQALIAVNFDDHLLDARPISRDADESMLDIGNEIAAKVPTEEVQNAVAGAEIEVELAEDTPIEAQHEPVASLRADIEMVEAHAHEPAQHLPMGVERNVDQDGSTMQTESRRQTVNFNEFFDVAALTEPTAELNLEDLIPHLDQSKAGEAFEDTFIHTSEPTSEYKDTVGVTTPQRVATPSAEDTVAGAENDDGVNAFAAQQDTLNVNEEDMMHEDQVPHYALSTIAFDARRKSLPAISHSTPMKSSTRPNTSDGASMPRIANPFAHAWWNRSGANSTAATPTKARPSTAHVTPSGSRFGTLAKPRLSSTPLVTPNERYPLLSRQNFEGHANTVAAPARFGTPAQKSPKRRETFHRAVEGDTITRSSQAKASSPAPSAPATPKERFPALRSRDNYVDHAQTISAPARFGTPAQKSPKRRETFHRAVEGVIIQKPTEAEAATPLPCAVATPRERFPALRSRENYEDHAKTVAAPKRFQTPAAKSPNRRQTFHKAAPGKVNTPKTDSEVATPVQNVAATPQPASIERFPRLRPRYDYEEHARTVAGPVRFQTPVKTTPLKRPRTAAKSDSLRKAALTGSTPRPSNTPMKTPLKDAAMTPSQAPMTPHPAAPLRGITALVEVFTLEGASASAPFVALLHRLGAKTARAWNDRITHVIFKDGSPLTLQRVRLNNKEFEQSGKGTFVHCVNSRWVTDCETDGSRVDESSEEYVVDVAEVPRGGKRRRKSMEPSALLNLGGNIVRDRKSSLGRKSLSRSSPWKVDFAEKKDEETPVATPDVEVTGKENSPDGQSSPATPAWIAAPGQLVQQTAPMKRVRKLELPGKEAKNRRLTFWNGGS